MTDGDSEIAGHPNDRAQVKRQFDCGHEKRVTIRNLNRYGTVECADCRMTRQQAERNTPEATAARRKEYRERVAKQGPRPKLSDEQRQAQRRILGILRTSATLTPDALLITRAMETDGLGANAHQVTDMLETLGITYSVALRISGKTPRVDVRIERDQWPRMVEILPSLASLLQ